MKMTNWHRPISDDPNLGINSILINAIKRNDAFGIFNVNCEVEVIIHSYREIGTAVEVALEARYKFFDGSIIVKFQNIVI